MDLEKLLSQLDKMGKPVKVNLSIEIGQSEPDKNIEEDNNPVGFEVN